MNLSASKSETEPIKNRSRVLKDLERLTFITRAGCQGRTDDRPITNRVLYH